MRTFSSVLILLASLSLISCSKTIISFEEDPIILAGGCEPVGVHLKFKDSCSYNFIMNFISEYNTVEILESYLGFVFFIYPDSGDYDYWVNYFAGDRTIKRIDGINPEPDSLILAIKVSGEKTIEEETERFTQIPHLTITQVIHEDNSLVLDVPENSEERWENFFKQFTFIEYSFSVWICTDS
jgi:hypothetical protein